jgi:hypothetical protein
MIPIMTQPAHPPLVNVQFRLGVAGPESSVEVSLRSFGDRWMAVAHIGGEPQIGLGRTAREALVGSLVSLGQPAVRALLVDLALLAPSVEIARQEGWGA